MITADLSLSELRYRRLFEAAHDGILIVDPETRQIIDVNPTPPLAATADFWASRVERNGPGHYDIKDVVAADEWAENVDNNAFTNAAASANLRFATAAAKLLGLKADPDWEVVAQNIPVLKFPDGVTREFETYKGEGIKQADVNLLAYPLKTITDPAQIKKDHARKTLCFR